MEKFIDGQMSFKSFLVNSEEENMCTTAVSCRDE
jgi:hypothetical protein